MNAVSHLTLAIFMPLFSAIPVSYKDAHFVLWLTRCGAELDPGVGDRRRVPLLW